MEGKACVAEDKVSIPFILKYILRISHQIYSGMDEQPKICLIETQYFPSIAFFALYQQVDQIHVEQHENYRKGSYRNRCHIAGANGLLRLSIPLEKGKNNQLNIQDVKISEETNWRLQHKRAIQSAYGKSPFFEYYDTEILSLFDEVTPSLFDWNLKIIQTLIEVLDLDQNKLHFSKTFEKKSLHKLDYRNQISPKQPSSSIENIATYPQVFSDKRAFLPNLSILDALFCMGPETILYLEDFPT